MISRLNILARLPKNKSPIKNKNKYNNNHQINFINSNIYTNANTYNNISSKNIQKGPPNPLNDIQKKYMNTLETIYPSIVIATGPAGSAKSFIAVSMGINEMVNKKYKRLIITRPTVPVDEDLGFLPGNINAKMDPWLRPLYDTFYKHYSVNEVKNMIDNKIIDICPISYLRGRTLEDSYIIVDEAQNTSINQMLMILTRIGNGSKMVLTGDLMQNDRGKNQINGLADFIQKIDNYNKNNASSLIDICHIKFNEEHVVRHIVIKYILNLYK